MKKDKQVKVESWLPLFPGFYGTSFDDESAMIMAIEDLNEERQEKGMHPIDMNDPDYILQIDLEFDFDDYKERVSKEVTNIIGNDLKEDGFISGVEYQKVNSPREYNFHNDSIDVIYFLSDDNIKNIKQEIELYWNIWVEFIKEKYKPGSGFIPFYSNNALDEEWDLDEAIYDSHKLGIILNFIIDYDLFDLLEECEEVNIIDITNQDELTDMSNPDAYSRAYQEYACNICGKIPQGYEMRHSLYLNQQNKVYICQDCQNLENTGRFMFNRYDELIFI